MEKIEERFDFARLKKNISDMIYEGMVKIGYQQNSVSVYYNSGLLAFLLGTEAENMTAGLWKDGIAAFKKYVEPEFGMITVKRKGDRFEFQVPEEGVRYIYEHNESREFLNKLVAVLKAETVTLEEVLTVFREVSEDLEIQEVDNSEFQYVISFKDTSIDEFKYCFTFDEMGHYYHRLVDYDLEQVLHHEH